MSHMGTKPSQPALYEKMRSRAVGAPTISPKVDLHPTSVQSVSDDGGSAWFSPGRSIRLPAGYLLLACGVGVLLLSVVYVFGHKRGYSVARSQFDQQVIDRSAGITDPLTTLQPVIDTSSSLRSGIAPPNASGDAGSPPSGGFRTTPAAAWGPIVPAKDPRQKGLNYFVIAETSESGARTLAEFCRSQGLETYVVPAKNDRFRAVAFPGFAGRDRSSPQVKALEAQIHTIGDNWKRNHKGTTDLRDAYASLYNG